MSDTCPLMRKLVCVHISPGADLNNAFLIYFKTKEEVYSNLYTIFVDKWDHNNGDEFDFSL